MTSSNKPLVTLIHHLLITLTNEVNTGSSRGLLLALSKNIRLGTVSKASLVIVTKPACLYTVNNVRRKFIQAEWIILIRRTRIHVSIIVLCLTLFVLRSKFVFDFPNDFINMIYFIRAKNFAICGMSCMNQLDYQYDT